jgi:hypothetical protein
MLKYIYNFFKNMFNKVSAGKCCSMAANEIKVRYLMNDPAYPELTITEINPVPYKLQYNIKYFTGQEAPFDKPEGKAMNVYGILCHANNVVNKKLNLNKWALVNVLQVNPLAGIQANAYYDREGLKFFSFNSKGKLIDTCMSSDIVSHELGHAILDAIKPEMFSSASMESSGFHESFGDVVSIFSALKHPQVVDILWSQTNGDLKKPNIVEKVAEQFGLALGMGEGLRTAINSFNYVKPELLPNNAQNDQLSSECHSYSRVMTGAVYDVICDLTVAMGNNKEGLDKATDFVIDTYLDACRVCPNTSNFYTAFANIWVSVCKGKNTDLAAIVTNSLSKRNLLNISLAAQSHEELGFGKKHDYSFGFDNCRIYKCTCDVPVASLLKDVVVEQNDDSVLAEIMQLNISLAADELVIAMGNGNQESIGSSLAEAAEAGKYFIHHLVENKLYGDGPDQPFYKDENNNLVRKFFACDCFNNNCKLMGSPEYGKCWKSKNNSGCCAYGSCAKDDNVKPDAKKPTGCCNVRYNSSCGSVRSSSCNSVRYNKSC